MKFFLFIVLSSYFLQTYCEEDYLYEDDERVPNGGINPSELRTDYLNHWNRIEHPLNETIPEEFDARKKWPGCKSIGRIQYQGKCNLGTYFAVGAIIDDRLCIRSNQTLQWQTSVEDLVNCCLSCSLNDILYNEKFTCETVTEDGVLLDNIEKFWVVSGGDINSNFGCKPTSESLLNGSFKAVCKMKCTNPSYKVPYRNDSIDLTYAAVSAPVNISQVQTELMKNGPLLAPLVMVADLREKLSDKSFTGVFDYKRSYKLKQELVEMVRVIGWGSEGDVPYWLIASTFNVTGFFKIRRGVNLLDIETFMWALDPIVPKKKPEKSKSGCQVGTTVGHLCFMLVILHWFF